MMKIKPPKRKQRINAGPDPDFQSIWPPHLFVGLSVIMIQVLIMPSVNTIGAIAYPGAVWLFVAVQGVTFVAFMLSHILITRGRVGAVHAVRTITSIYIILSIPLLWHDEFSTFGYVFLGTAIFHLWLTFNWRYILYIMYFHVIWERYRERLAAAEVLANKK